MKITYFDESPVAVVPYLNAGRRPNDFYEDSLPVYRAAAEHLPESVDALVITADLQGLDTDPLEPGLPCPLLGETLPYHLDPVLASLGVRAGNRVAAFLAGDFYTYPDLHGRGGTGDVTSVWRAFENAYRWVVGVAGNHDTFGGKNCYRPKMKRPETHLMDANRIEIEGMRIAGISGVIGNPRKNFRRTHDEYLKSLDQILKPPTDILLMHEGPDIPGKPRCRGVTDIRDVIEKQKQKPSIVIRGHKHWPQPLHELGGGTQVLNVEAAVVIVTSG